MRGIVLAGGRGTRLAPLTLSVNKHLLPVYDQPLVHWPVMTLVRIGVDSITIVANPEDIERFEALFGDGSAFGIPIDYAVQESASGVAGALAAAKREQPVESLAVILGDNVFMDAKEIEDAVESYRASGEKGGMVFLKEVPDPERFGVATIENGVITDIIEKPEHPASNFAVTGFYLFDAKAFDLVRTLTPSARGELEITDLNQDYIRRRAMQHRVLSSDWIDAGTHESLLQANLMAAGMEYDADKKVKILFGINKLAVGGAEHLVLHQLRRVNRHRFDPYLVTLLPSGEPNLDTEATYLGDHWKRFVFKGFFDLVSWWRLYRYLLRERFDVVVANLFFTSIILRSAALLAGVPMILSAELNAYTKRNAKWRPLERFLAHFTARFIASSKDVLEATARDLDLPKEKFALNYNAIDLANTRPPTAEERAALRARYGVSSDDFIIVTAGRLVEQKGQSFLIDAFATVKQRHPERHVKLMIFGEGPLRTELSNQANALGLKDTVLLPGVAQVADIVGLADIFVLPSLWEGLSLMLLEAMAAGNPILGTAISGTSELIVDGVNGFLVPPGDSTALAEKLDQLVVDDALRSGLSRGSRKEVQKFSIQSNLNNLYTIIRTSRRKHEHHGKR
jgi:glucose-1-phosphate thymidylyltransferase